MILGKKDLPIYLLLSVGLGCVKRVVKMSCFIPLIPCFAVVLLALSFNVDASDVGEVEFELGNQKLSIPKKIVLESHLDLGMSQTAPVLLEAESISESIKGYQVYGNGRKNDLFLTLSGFGGEKEYYSSKWYTDVWHGRGYYDRRIIERHELSEFYKMYRRGDSLLWKLLRVYPD